MRSSRGSRGGVDVSDAAYYALALLVWVLAGVLAVLLR